MTLSFQKIVGIALGIYVLAAVVPGALTNFFGADTSGWDAGSIALWGLIPLLVIVALAYAYLPGGRSGKGA